MVAAKFLINHPSSLPSSLTLTSSSTPFVQGEADHLPFSSSLTHEYYMDLKSQTVFTIEPASDASKAKNKNKSVGKVFKVVFFMMLRRRSKKSKESVDMGPDKGMWRRLLGSMSPLHIHGNEEPPAPAATVVHSNAPSKAKEDFDDSLPMPPSRSPSSSSFSPPSRSSSFNRSEYTSANNLHELDDGSHGEGDEMIDAKAEEFIAQFYEQMRRQRYDIY